MNLNSFSRAMVAGWLGGFLGNGLLGALFSSPMIRELLYDPAWQSELFIAITPQRNIAVSVIGLVALSGVHGVFFSILRESIPGKHWLEKGLWWGFAVWTLYWLFQEWFIYITLLREPLVLASLELCILLLGSLLEGVVIAAVANRRG